MPKVKKILTPKLKKIKDFIIKHGKDIGYLEALKELYRLGYHIDDLKAIKLDDFVMGKLEKECRRKNLLKNKDRKKINY